MAIPCLNQIEYRWFCLEIDSDLNSIVRKARQIDSISINPSSFRKILSMHGWFAIQKNDTPLFFAFLTIQEQHVVLSGKRPFYCWRTWGFRRRGRVRVGGFLWGWGERTTVKHPSTLWGKRSSKHFYTHPRVLHGKNISGCLGLSCFFAWKSMNMNKFVPKTDEVIPCPNQQFWSISGISNSSPMAPIEGPAEFHCLLHRPAGMQQVVAVEGLKLVWCQTTLNRRHPKNIQDSLKRASLIWVHFGTC